MSFQEFPKVVYKGGDTQGKYLVVIDADNEAAALINGFEPGKLPGQIEPNEEANELAEKAVELGIKIDGRRSQKRIKGAIAQTILEAE